MSCPTAIVVASIEDLTAAIGEHLAALAETYRQPVQAREKKYLTQADVSALTGWSRRQLAYRRSMGDLPYIKRGRTVLYKRDDVERFLEEGYVPSGKSKAPSVR
jgi:hypothetical protein